MGPHYSEAVQADVTFQQHAGLMFQPLIRHSQVSIDSQRQHRGRARCIEHAPINLGYLDEQETETVEAPCTRHPLLETFSSKAYQLNTWRTHQTGFFTHDTWKPSLGQQARQMIHPSNTHRCPTIISTMGLKPGGRATVERSREGQNQTANWQLRLYLLQDVGDQAGPNRER